MEIWQKSFPEQSPSKNFLAVNIQKQIFRECGEQFDFCNLGFPDGSEACMMLIS